MPQKHFQTQCAQKIRQSNICKSDGPRIHATVTFSNLMRPEPQSQQHLQIRCAENFSHSNICRSANPRINVTATCSNPMRPERQPRKYLQNQCAQNQYHSSNFKTNVRRECHNNICKFTRRIATTTFANPMCPEPWPQQDLQIRRGQNQNCTKSTPQQLLQIRCAQAVNHSNICKYDVPRIMVTATFSNPTWPESNVRTINATTTFTKSDAPRTFATATFANLMCPELMHFQSLRKHTSRTMDDIFMHGLKIKIFSNGSAAPNVC